MAGELFPNGWTAMRMTAGRGRYEITARVYPNTWRYWVHIRGFAETPITIERYGGRTYLREDCRQALGDALGELAQELQGDAKSVAVQFRDSVRSNRRRKRVRIKEAGTR